jgi:hypothetical protein
VLRARVAGMVGQEEYLNTLGITEEGASSAYLLALPSDSPAHLLFGLPSFRIIQRELIFQE